MSSSSILKGILQNRSTYNYPGVCADLFTDDQYYKSYFQYSCKQVLVYNINCIIIFLFHLTAVRFGRVPKREKAKILAAMQSSRMKTQESKVMGELNDDAKIIDCIVRAHYDTCDYTRKKMDPFLQSAKANPKYISCSGTVSFLPLSKAKEDHIFLGSFLSLSIFLRVLLINHNYYQSLLPFALELELTIWTLWCTKNSRRLEFQYYFVYCLY